MNKVDWIKQADDYIQHEYGLPIDHGCFTESEFYARFGEDGQKTPKESVDDFAQKYDLFSRSECWSVV